MVWEQGSVVIVMLTRLTENGEAMCYRYWPEEGSDLYHIYEVRTCIVRFLLYPLQRKFWGYTGIILSIRVYRHDSLILMNRFD